MLDIILFVIALATGAPDATSGPGVVETAYVPVPVEPVPVEPVPVEPVPVEPVPVAPASAAPAAETAEARNFSSAEDLPPGLEAPVVEAPALPYEAEQQVATGRFLTALEIKPIMNATRSNWIAVREFDGQDLVYTTHVWSWRCGLVALHVGLNGAAPEPWPRPDCHEDTNSPNAILPDDGLPYRAFPLGSVETMTVELIYDDLTTEKVTFNRQGALLP
jgi:hypothetical protein